MKLNKLEEAVEYILQENIKHLEGYIRMYQVNEAKDKLLEYINTINKNKQFISKDYLISSLKRYDGFKKRIDNL